MTTLRNRYIEMRNNNKYNIAWFYEYFVSEGGTLDYDTFSGVFFLSTELLEHVDVKLGLTRIYDKNNKFIMVL